MQRRSSDPDRRTAQQVDDDLGDVLVESVTRSRSNSTLLRVLSVPLLFDLLLSIGLAGGYVKFRNQQYDTCRKFNESRRGELALWGPVLAAPRAPLRPGATDAEQRAYNEATRARDTFEVNLHRYFDPVKC